MMMHNRHSGFTLIEAVIVIAIAGIVGSMVAVFITRPVEGYAALSRRAELVDQAEQALKRMQRDVRRALPNSLRIKTLGAGAGQVLEILHVRTGGRYRTEPGGGVYSTAACLLDFTAADGSFAFMDTWDLPREQPMPGDRLVISNWTAVGAMANAYSGDNLAPSDITYFAPGGACGIEAYLTFTAFQFPRESDQKRFYIVDTPVTYLCDTGTGELRRYENYSLNLNQTDVDTAAELIAAGAANPSPLVVDGITSCNFTYNSGTPTRGGLVTVGLNVSQDNETIALQQQFHVDNIP